MKRLIAAAPFGLRSYWKSNFLRELTDDAIDTFVRCAEPCPSPRTFVILEHSARRGGPGGTGRNGISGAAARVRPGGPEPVG